MSAVTRRAPVPFFLKQPPKSESDSTRGAIPAVMSEAPSRTTEVNLHALLISHSTFRNIFSKGVDFISNKIY